MTADQLHTHAIEAEKHAEQLATGLAQISAPPDAVKLVTQCAGLLRKVAEGLAKGGMQAEAGPPPTVDEAVTAHMAQRRAAPPAAPAGY